MPAARVAMGASAPLPDLRARRLLRFLARAGTRASTPTGTSTRSSAPSSPARTGGGATSTRPSSRRRASKHPLFLSASAEALSPLRPPVRAMVVGQCSCTRRTAIEPSPTAEATRLIEPLRTSPTANMPGRLVSSGSGAPAVGGGRGVAPPVRTKPLSSSATSSPSHPVCGSAPMKTNSARASTRRAAPVCRCPRRPRASSAVLAEQLAHLGVAPDLDVRDALDAVDQVARHVLAQVVARGSSAARPRCTCATRNTAACPAELPPPTTTTGSPAQSCASIGVAA